MNIFVFGTRGFPNVQGGVEKHCEHLYPLMPGRYKITCFRRKAYIAKGKQASPYPNIRFIDLPSTRVKGFEAFFHSLLCAACCILKRPDVVHIHNIGPGLFIPLLKFFGLKTILTYHSPNYEHAKWGFLGKAILRFSERCALRHADALIFINRNQMEKYSPAIRAKSTLIPNGIEIKPRFAKPFRITRLGLQPRSYILAVGRLTQEKGFDYLIDAFLSLPDEEIKLVIAGGADHKSAYADRLRRKASPRILFTGFVEGKLLQELYSLCRLFVLPSHNEGYPLALLEAVGYNLPLLASDIPANKQLRLPLGCYFRAGSASHLAEEITRKLQENTCRQTYSVDLPGWLEVAERVAARYEQFLPE